MCGVSTMDISQCCQSITKNVIHFILKNLGMEKTDWSIISNLTGHYVLKIW
jgi:hypothetical protein